ncbi:tetratricopeptide repeat protein [Helicobacter turcicus]|uniref:Tetratricopeptide repeat protein n=1 Tax=Helicobacter turcicus TaxID=2867412 RepID=A0ABS7JNS5_9HELI|nr:tetratricopeptide repeat protein [Helicobacter turcicus]MBX7491047.1 tetratricopeptide repeat protein [Helicobacter turcicus]MBX7546308.1 tetratricopeptide repeat protein [Helicobacter turcicus]
MKTLTLASIYEIQGHRHEAAEIYKAILEEDPSNTEAKIALKRLVSNRKNYGKANEDMLSLFIQMDSSVEFNEFERWLLQLWN